MSSLFRIQSSPYWYYTNGDGKSRIKKSTGTKNKKLAEMLQRKWDDDLFMVKHGFKSQNKDIRHIALSYLKIIENRKGRGWGKKIKSSINVFIAYCGKTNANNIDNNYMDNYIHHRQAQGRSPKTIREEIKIIANLFDYAIKNKYCLINPCTELILPKLITTRPNKAFSRDELNKLLSATTINRDIILYKVLYFTGLRFGDAISIEKEMLKNGAIERTQTKTGNKVIIPLHKELKGMDICKIMPYSCISRVRKRIKRIVPWANIHTFRHTFATHLEDYGASRYDIKVLLGHRTGDITANYIHTNIDRLNKLINSLSI